MLPCFIGWNLFLLVNYHLTPAVSGWGLSLLFLSASSHFECLGNLCSPGISALCPHSLVSVEENDFLMIVMALCGWIIGEVVFARVLYNFEDKDHTSATLCSSDIDRFVHGG